MILLADNLLKNLFKQLLLLLHHVFHLFLCLFLQPEPPFLYLSSYLCLQCHLSSLFFLVFYCFFLSELTLFFFVFSFLKRGISIGERLPQIFGFFHKFKVPLLFLPGRQRDLINDFRLLIFILASCIVFYCFIFVQVLLAALFVEMSDWSRYDASQDIKFLLIGY